MEKIVRVSWRDSRLYIRQCEKDDDFAYCVLFSVGFVIQEDKEQIVLSGDLVDGDVRRVIVIPRENIINIKNLK